MKNRTYLLLHENNLYKAFIILAFPVFGANLLKSLHDLVDTYFIGQMEQSIAAQAGIAAAWPLISILMAFNAGLSVAGVAVISQLSGAGKRQEAKNYSGLLLVLSILFGLLIQAVLYIAAPLVMGWMGAEGETLVCAVTYLRVRSFEMLFVFIFTAFQAIRQAQGDTITPVILSVISIAINIVLTGTFIRIFNMGVFGAALATVIGQIVIAPICLFLLFRPGELLHLEKKDLKVSFPNMRQLAVLAAPSAGSQALSSFGFLVLQAFILDYGDTVTAAFSIGNKVSNLLLIPITALGSILAAYIGQNIGAHNKERALQAYRVSRNLGLGISIFGSLVIFPFREVMLGLLTNSDATLLAALDYIFWVLATQPLMSLFQNYMGVFNGSGNTRYSFIIATARLWVIRLPLILLFKNFTPLGSSGIWYAMCISNFLILLPAAWLFRKVDFEPKLRESCPDSNC